MTTPDQRAEHPLDDLAARLNEKAVALDELAERQDRSRSHYTRLKGKAEGVRLALSFVEEVIRGDV